MVILLFMTVATVGHEPRAGPGANKTVRCYNVVTSTCQRLCNH